MPETQTTELEYHYKTPEEIALHRPSVKIGAWISPDLKQKLERTLRPVGGKISTLVRYLLEEWVTSRE